MCSRQRPPASGEVAFPTRAGGALRARPLLRVALPLLRLRRLRGTVGARPRGAHRRLPRRARRRARPARRCARCVRQRSGGRSAASTWAAARRRCCAAAEVARLLGHVRRRVGIEDGAEVTIEANPGPDERGDLAGFAAAGVTRLSLGAQSMEASELRRLGRRHTPGDVLAAVAEARRAGIGSVSIDVLYDVPGQTEASVAAHARGTARRRRRPRLGLRADARRSRRRGAHGPARRPPAHPPRGAGVARAGPRRAGRRPGRRPVPPRGRAARPRTACAGTSCRTGRDRDTRAGTTWPTGATTRTRRSARAPMRSTGARCAGGTRPDWTDTSPRCCPRLRRCRRARDTSPRLPPGGEERLDPATFAAEEAILGLRLREGIGPESPRGPRSRRQLPGRAATGSWRTARAAVSGCRCAAGCSPTRCSRESSDAPAIDTRGPRLVPSPALALTTREC